MIEPQVELKERDFNMFRYVFLIATLLLLVSVSSVPAVNYVNWKGNFWFGVPEGWEKVNYIVVDRYLAMSDTSRDVFNYEVVYAPTEPQPFPSGAYVVVTFEEVGELSNKQADSILDIIASSYADDIFEAPIVNLMSDLVPGKPKINRAKRAISFLSDMAFQGGAIKKVWQYMRLNNKGLISLYFYSPDSIYSETKPIFDGIVSSLSFENLREAAKGENLKFTDVSGGENASAGTEGGLVDPDEAEAASGISRFKNILLLGIGLVIVVGLLWMTVIAPRMKKKQE
jgi:hypothetical protein